MTEFTILMPCLNEAATVGNCVAKARGFLVRAAITGEVLVADNGSRDGSRAVAEQAGARVVEVVERGYGAALAGGIAAARGRYVIMGDADDSYDFGRLEGFVARPRSRDGGLPKFPPRCSRTAADGRRICADGATAGATCASCCSSAPAGCSCIRGSP